MAERQNRRAGDGKISIKSSRKDGKKRKIFLSLLFFMGAFTIFFSHFFTERGAYAVPEYEKCSLERVAKKVRWSEGDYALIYWQTGLGKAGADAIRKKTEDQGASLEAQGATFENRREPFEDQREFFEDRQDFFENHRTSLEETEAASAQAVGSKGEDAGKNGERVTIGETEEENEERVAGCERKDEWEDDGRRLDFLDKFSEKKSNPLRKIHDGKWEQEEEERFEMGEGSHGNELLAVLERYQNQLFAEENYFCEKVNAATREEIRGDGKRQSTGEAFADLQEGDVLLTKAAHTLGFRHGHAALVVDTVKGYTLEAVSPGQNSKLQSIEKWRNYPTFVQLRLKEEFRTPVLGKQIALYSLCSLKEIPYGIFSAPFMKHQKGIIEKTQCAYLIWAAYRHFGLDVDGGRDPLVLPADLAKSPCFEVVQAYGVDLEDLW